MTRQSSIIDASARALSHFDRMSQVARESVRVMRAAESMALPGKYRWEFPEKDSLLKNKQSFEAGLLFKRRIVGDGSGRGSIGDPGWSETDDRNRPRGGIGRQRAAMVSAGARVVRAIPDLSRAMNALSQVESGSVGGAALDSRKYAPTRLASNSDASVPSASKSRKNTNVVRRCGSTGQGSRCPIDSRSRAAIGCSAARVCAAGGRCTCFE